MAMMRGTEAANRVESVSFMCQKCLWMSVCSRSWFSMRGLPLSRLSRSATSGASTTRFGFTSHSAQIPRKSFFVMCVSVRG